MRTREENDRLNKLLKEFLEENFKDEDEDIVVEDFKYKGNITFLNWEIDGNFSSSGLKAKEIEQSHQVGKVIWQNNQVAHNIWQIHQTANRLYQDYQTAHIIVQGHHIAKEIYQEEEE